MFPDEGVPWAEYFRTAARPVVEAQLDQLVSDLKNSEQLLPGSQICRQDLRRIVSMIPGVEVLGLLDEATTVLQNKLSAIGMEVTGE